MTGHVIDVANLTRRFNTCPGCQDPRNSIRGADRDRETCPHCLAIFCPLHYVAHRTIAHRKTQSRA